MFFVWIFKVIFIVQSLVDEATPFLWKNHWAATNCYPKAWLSTLHRKIKTCLQRK